MVGIGALVAFCRASICSVAVSNKMDPHMMRVPSSEMESAVETPVTRRAIGTVDDATGSLVTDSVRRPRGRRRVPTPAITEPSRVATN